MHSFLWNCFQATGNIEAYLMLKNLEEQSEKTLSSTEEKELDQEEGCYADSI